MEDFVIVRTSDETGEMTIFGPYEEVEAKEIIKRRSDHAYYAYYTKVLEHPMELR